MSHERMGEREREREVSEMEEERGEREREREMEHGRPPELLAKGAACTEGNLDESPNRVHAGSPTTSATCLGDVQRQGELKLSKREPFEAPAGETLDSEP